MDRRTYGERVKKQKGRGEEEEEEERTRGRLVEARQS